MQNAAISMLETDGFALERQGLFLVARLKAPHLVLSTSAVNGGQTEHLRYLVNHQSCEGKGHAGRHHDLAVGDRDAYHAAVCGEAGLPPATTAMMGTAANMQNAAVRTEAFAEISVAAAVTAGVQGNAGRAGDPARWHEGEAEWKPVQALPGTINTLVVFNWPLTPAALARAAATMTEAKSAVLQELAVGSRSSAGLATGTGTDQFCLAAPIDAARKAKTWTGKHGKLGEILALAVMGATREALKWQNGLEPSRTRNLAHALGRFGVEEEKLLRAMEDLLEEKDRALLRANSQAVMHEPQTAGAAYALAAVRDRIAYGVLPPAAGRELMINQAALMACALAARPEAFPEFRTALGAAAARGPDGAHDVPALAAEALALGWREKWNASR
jgi:adenosylcobinamide amidohydrolase